MPHICSHFTLFYPFFLFFLSSVPGDGFLVSFLVLLIFVPCKMALETDLGFIFCTQKDTPFFILYFLFSFTILIILYIRSPYSQSIYIQHIIYPYIQMSTLLVCYRPHIPYLVEIVDMHVPTYEKLQRSFPVTLCLTNSFGRIPHLRPSKSFATYQGLHFALIMYSHRL